MLFLHNYLHHDTDRSFPTDSFEARSDIQKHFLRFEAHGMISQSSQKLPRRS